MVVNIKEYKLKRIDQRIADIQMLLDYRFDDLTYNEIDKLLDILAITQLERLKLSDK